MRIMCIYFIYTNSHDVDNRGLISKDNTDHVIVVWGMNCPRSATPLRDSQTRFVVEGRILSDTSNIVEYKYCIHLDVLNCSNFSNLPRKPVREDIAKNAVLRNYYH